MISLNISIIFSYGFQFVKFLTGGLDFQINVSYTETPVPMWYVEFIMGRELFLYTAGRIDIHFY